MIDSSAAYGLYNPAFTEDIGKSAIGRMFPTTGDMDEFRVAGTDFSNVDIQHKLLSDTVDFKKKQKRNNLITGAIIGIGVLALGALVYKFGKPLLTKIGKLFKKGGPTKAWNKIKKAPIAVWNFIKSIPTKIGKLFKK